MRYAGGVVACAYRLIAVAWVRAVLILVCGR